MPGRHGAGHHTHVLCPGLGAGIPPLCGSLHHPCLYADGSAACGIKQTDEAGESFPDSGAYRRRGKDGGAGGTADSSRLRHALPGGGISGRPASRKHSHPWISCAGWI